ncbi:MAG: winged helix DNA-binding domain-containing protein [Propionibacteriaceae bacterium]
MSDDAARQVLRRRLATQGLVGHRFATARDVVSGLACVQSQEYAHGFWSLGMRTTELTYTDVQREFDAGLFIRTHILRPTWHFVAAEDLRWILALTSPRVLQGNRSRCRQLELDQADLDRGCELIVAALSGGRHLTRNELGRVMDAAGLPAPGQRLAYLVMTAELEGLICSGPMRGAQHTYAVLDERLPATPARTEEEALAELTWRYLSGHGPTSLKDFTRWSSLTLASAEAGLASVADRLERLEVDGQVLWFDPAAGEPAADVSEALLLPLYDEATLSYPQLNFPLATGHPHPPDMDTFIGSVVVDAVNVGTWRRTVKGRKVLVETALTPGLSARGRDAVDAAVIRLAGFLGKELERVPMG